MEPRKEFRLQDPVADWLVAVSASVGVAGAEPPKPRPLATLTTSTVCSSVGSPPPFNGRPLPAFTLPLPARTYTHTHTHSEKKNSRGVCWNQSIESPLHLAKRHRHTHEPPSSGDCFALASPCGRERWRPETEPETRGDD